MSHIHLATELEISQCAILLSDRLTTPFDESLRLLQKPTMSVIVAVENDEIVGFLVTQDRVVFTTFTVEDTDEQKHLTELIAHFESIHSDDAKLYIYAKDMKPQVANLCERLGYINVGAFPNFNYTNQDQSFYRKSPKSLASV